MAKPKKPTVVDEVLEKGLKRFKESYNYQRENWHWRWERDNKLYDNIRVKRSYEGITDTFIPLPFQTIETMVAALNNAEVKIDYKSTDPTKKLDVAPLNALVDEYAEEDSWDLNSEDSYREVLKVGMDANMLSWDIDHPHEESFAMMDAIVDPTIKNPAQLQEPGHFAGRRYLVRKGSMDDIKIVDTDQDSKTYGELVNRYKSTPDDSLANTTSEPTDRQAKEDYSGSTLNAEGSEQDEIIEIWDVDRVVTIKNRKYTIEDTVNPYKQKHEQILLQKYLATAGDDPEKKAKARLNAKSEAKGINPFYFYRNYRKKSLFYATSEIQSIASEVERLNDLTNLETDYIMKQVAGQRELDPKYEDWIDLINNDPDTVYPFEVGSLRNIDMPILPQNAFNNRVEIKNTVREATAISEAANGTLSDKDRTKFEVSSALSQTGARIESKARIFKHDALYWKYWILIKLIQLNVDKPLVVYAPDATVDSAEVAAKYGIELPAGCAIFDPADYQGNLKPSITLEVDAQSKQADERNAARENYQIIIQDPTNNLKEAKEILYPKMFKLDKEDIERIVTPDPATALPADPMAGGNPSAIPPVDPAMAALPAAGVPNGL